MQRRPLVLALPARCFRQESKLLSFVPGCIDALQYLARARWRRRLILCPGIHSSKLEYCKGSTPGSLQTAGNIFLGTARWLERLEEQYPGREIFPVRQALVRSGACDVIAWAAVSLVEQGDPASHGPGGLMLNCSVLIYRCEDTWEGGGVG